MMKPRTQNFDIQFCVRAFLSASLSFSFIFSTPAALAANTCEEIFIARTQNPLRAPRQDQSQLEVTRALARQKKIDDQLSPIALTIPGTEVEPNRPLFGLPDFDAKKAERRREFDTALFERELQRYNSIVSLKQIHSLTPPTTPEGKIAAFEALSRLNGRSILNLEDTMQKAKGPLRARLRNLFGSIDMAKGASAFDVENIFMKIYLLSHSDPMKFGEILSRTLSQTERIFLLQRFNIAFSRRGLIEAYNELGWLASPGIREKLREEYRRDPTVYNVIYMGGSAATIMALYHIPFLLPTHVLTHYKFLSPKTAAIGVLRGPEFIFSELKRVSKNSAKVDAAIKVGSSVIMLSAFAFVTAMFIQNNVTKLMNPAVSGPDDNFFQFVYHTVLYGYRQFRRANHIPISEKELAHAPEVILERNIIETSNDFQVMADASAKQIANEPEAKLHFAGRDGVDPKPTVLTDDDLRAAGLPVPSRGDTAPTQIPEQAPTAAQVNEVMKTNPLAAQNSAEAAASQNAPTETTQAVSAPAANPTSPSKDDAPVIPN